VQQVGGHKNDTSWIGAGWWGEWQEGQGRATLHLVLFKLLFLLLGANGYYFTRFQLQLYLFCARRLNALCYKMKFYALSAAFC